MDDLRVGSMIRAVRHRLGWTQSDLAARAGISQRTVSAIEGGHLERATVRAIRAVAAALEVRLAFAPQWRGGDALRLLDSGHAAIVNHVVAILTNADWETVVEYTFSRFGERGAVDIVGWHATTRTLVVVEAKTRLLDTQETIATHRRKVRLVPQLLATERGWHANAVGALLVLDSLSANRRAVAAHAATFVSAYPARSRTARRWVSAPSGHLSALWFLSPSATSAGKRHSTSVRRVRRRPSRLPPPSELAE